MCLIVSIAPSLHGEFLHPNEIALDFWYLCETSDFFKDFWTFVALQNEGCQIKPRKVNPLLYLETAISKKEVIYSFLLYLSFNVDFTFDVP